MRIWWVVRCSKEDVWGFQGRGVCAQLVSVVIITGRSLWFIIPSTATETISGLMQMNREVTRWITARASEKWKKKGLWSITESGVHLGNGQRIIKEQGQKQFHYPLHPDLSWPCISVREHAGVCVSACFFKSVLDVHIGKQTDHESAPLSHPSAPFFPPHVAHVKRIRSEGRSDGQSEKLTQH